MIDFDSVRESAKGKWISIFRNLGINVPEDGRHSFCPICSPGDKKSDRFRLDRDSAQNGSYYCSQCGPSNNGFTLIMKVMGIDIKEAMQAVSDIVGGCEKNSVPKEVTISPDRLRKMFLESTPASHDNLVGEYLKSRGLSIVPECLRHYPKCWESETKKEQNAMLSLISLPDNTAIGFHRTYLTPDGDKMDIVAPKKVTPLLQKNVGGSIKIFDVTDDRILAIAEGVETALAFYEDTGVKCWSVISTSGMESFVPPKHIDRMVVVSDNDDNFAGQKSAYSIANRLEVQMKIKTEVYVPLVTGDDWLDQLNRSKTIDVDNS